MKVAVLANWGIGGVVLETLARMENIVVSFAVSDFDPKTPGPWQNTVLETAEAFGLSCFRPGEFSRMELANRLGEVDLMICHAWKTILTEDVFGAPRIGSINLHPSLLPKFRGPSPHKWVAESQETEHGITCHVMDSGVDSGPIIAQKRVSLTGNESSDALVELLKPLVKPLIETSISRILDPDFRPLPQDVTRITYAHRI